VPNFKVVVNHAMQRDLVVGRLRDFSEQIRSNAPLVLSEIREVWDETGNLEFSFSAKGLQISGSMTTTHSDVTVDGKLPWVALPLKSSLESQIAFQIRQALGM